MVIAQTAAPAGGCGSWAVALAGDPPPAGKGRFCPLAPPVSRWGQLPLRITEITAVTWLRRGQLPDWRDPHAQCRCLKNDTRHLSPSSVFHSVFVRPAGTAER